MFLAVTSNGSVHKTSARFPSCSKLMPSCKPHVEQEPQSPSPIFLVYPPLSMPGDPQMSSNASVENYPSLLELAEQAHNPLDLLWRHDHEKKLISFSRSASFPASVSFSSSRDVPAGSI